MSHAWPNQHPKSARLSYQSQVRVWHSSTNWIKQWEEVRTSRGLEMKREKPDENAHRYNSMSFWSCTFLRLQKVYLTKSSIWSCRVNRGSQYLLLWSTRARSVQWMGMDVSHYQTCPRDGSDNQYERITQFPRNLSTNVVDEKMENSLMISTLHWQTFTKASLTCMYRLLIQ
jgi:hypothetical protein